MVSLSETSSNVETILVPANLKYMDCGVLGRLGSHSQMKHLSF